MRWPEVSDGAVGVQLQLPGCSTLLGVGGGGGAGFSSLRWTNKEALTNDYSPAVVAVGQQVAPWGEPSDGER